MTIANQHHVLVVEDEYFLASDLRDSLEGEGMIVVGPVANEADALALLDNSEIDCAVLDINLNGRMSYSVAQTLRDRGIPFLFVTGYDTAAEGSTFDDVELIQKPFSRQAVVDTIARLTTGGAQPST